jgi:hypothetical protein
MVRDCWSKKSSKSPLRPPNSTNKRSRPAGTWKVGTTGSHMLRLTDMDITKDPLTYLYSSDPSDEVRQVHVWDRRSQPRRTTVVIQDVPAKCLIDTRADITIMGGDLLKKVAAVAHLRKKDFKKADKVPVTYVQQPQVSVRWSHWPWHCGLGHPVWEDYPYSSLRQNGCRVATSTVKGCVQSALFGRLSPWSGYYLCTRLIIGGWARLSWLGYLLCLSSWSGQLQFCPTRQWELMCVLSMRDLILMQCHPNTAVPSVNVLDSRARGEFFLRERVM